MIHGARTTKQSPDSGFQALGRLRYDGLVSHRDQGYPIGGKVRLRGLPNRGDAQELSFLSGIMAVSMVTAGDPVAENVHELSGGVLGLVRQFGYCLNNGITKQFLAFSVFQADSLSRRTFEGMLVACRESATTRVGQPGRPGGRDQKRTSAAPCLLERTPPWPASQDTTAVRFWSR